MSKFLCLITLALGFATPSFAQQTTLTVPGTVTDAQIDVAIDSLRRAKRSHITSARDKHIANAKKNLVASPATESFAAEVISEGDKQFTEETSGIPHLQAACFNGTPAETARLINRALALGQWEGDEERILSAAATGAKVNLKIEDQPNESTYDFELWVCEE